MSDDLAINTEDEINRLHTEICGFAQKTVEHALRIGELLTNKKAELDHVKWLPWLNENILFSPDTAERYRLIFERRDELKIHEVKTLNDAYRLIRNSNKFEKNLDKPKTEKLSDEKAFEAKEKEQEREHLVSSLSNVLAFSATDSMPQQVKSLQVRFSNYAENFSAEDKMRFFDLLDDAVDELREEAEKEV
jgi:hypothetical protein